MLMCLYDYIILRHILFSLVFVTLQTDGILPEKRIYATWTFQDDTNEAVMAFIFFSWVCLGHSFEILKMERKQLWGQHSFVFYTPPPSFLSVYLLIQGSWVQLCSPQSCQRHRSFLANWCFFAFGPCSVGAGPDLCSFVVQSVFTAAFFLHRSLDA